MRANDRTTCTINEAQQSRIHICYGTYYCTSHGCHGVSNHRQPTPVFVFLQPNNKEVSIHLHHWSFVRIHESPVSPHKGPLTQSALPCHDVTMMRVFICRIWKHLSLLNWRSCLRHPLCPHWDSINANIINTNWRPPMQIE